MRRPRQWLRWRWPLLGAAVGVILIMGGVGLVARVRAHATPVPISVRRAVNFAVAYPDPGKLPAGYKLDLGSFSTNSQAVVYVVRAPGGIRLVFTVQARPNDDQLATFYAHQIPLHLTHQTPLGLATIGAINGRTVASLPAATCWVLITGPPQLSQKQLNPVLDAMRLP